MKYTNLNLKLCTKCKQVKTTSDFYKDKSKKDGLHTRCKTCHTDYYNKNKDILKSKAVKYLREYRQSNKIKAVSYMGGCCSICRSVYPPLVYDFHHTEDESKEFNVGALMQCSWSKIKQEIDKTIMVCANCPRLITFGVITTC